MGGAVEDRATRQDRFQRAIPRKCGSIPEGVSTRFPVMRADIIQPPIDFEDIDTRFSQKAEKRLLHAAVNQRADPIRGQSTCLRHSLDLNKSRIGADIGVQPRCGGGHQIGRNGTTG